jgi:phosphoribosylglycinamide formyltransferase-1
LALRLGWFSSGREEADINIFRAVMSASERGRIDASVSFVFCDYDPGEDAAKPDFAVRSRFLDLVASYDVPLVNLSWQRLRDSWSHDQRTDWRVCFGKKMRKMIYERPFELGMVVGLTTPMDADSCTRFDLVGLYPSLPSGPRGDRSSIVCQLIRNRAERHGAMVRLCRPEGAEGTPVTYCSFPLNTPEMRPLWASVSGVSSGGALQHLEDEALAMTPLFKRIYHEEERRELPLVTYTLKLFADGDLDIVNGRLLTEGMALATASDLSQNVDVRLQQS